jgi:hypothetical protein
VIVAIAAWLYIIQALLSLGSLFSGPFGFGGGASSLPTLLVSGVFGAMGYGLLKREAWGRWLALGVSLLSWVFGSLMLVALIGALLVSGKSGEFISMMLSGAFVIIAVMLVIMVLIMLVSVVISFKLFFYLCSEEGCEEFGVPYGSAGTVVASVGAWIALMFGQVFLASGGGGGVAALLAQQAMSRNHDSKQRSDEEYAQRIETERREYQRLEERLRAIRDAETVAAVTPEPQAADSTYSNVQEEARAPVMMKPEKAPEAEKTSGSTILKCRDASGSVMFTQGYCPPGTQRVDMPRNE